MVRIKDRGMFFHQIHFIFIIVSAFASTFADLQENKSETGLLNKSSENVKDKDRDIFFGIIDLRGTVRKRFGFASLQNSDESSVCSPLAALLPLGKLALGAEGSALKQLYQAIGISLESGESDYSDAYYSDYTVIKYHISPLIKELRAVSMPVLDVASRLYVSDDKKLYKRFKKQAVGIFRTPILKINFTKANAMAEKVNGWVSSQTHGKISNIISSRDVLPQSSIVIVNAIYFSGTWVTTFSKPYESVFYTPIGERQLLMMDSYMHCDYAFSDMLYAQVLDIPYEQQNMSLLLVVPRQRNGLTNLITRIEAHPEYLMHAIENMERRHIQLKMPTFRIESQWDLGTIYQKIGLKSIFKWHGSGLSGITRKGDLHVSRAIQTAIIEVDYGKKYSWLGPMMSIWAARAVNVTADHPFLFYVRLKSQQLLMGTVNLESTCVEQLTRTTNTQTVKHNFQVLQSFFHDDNVVSESQVCDELAIDIDAPPVPIERFENVLRCIGKQFRGN